MKILIISDIHCEMMPDDGASFISKLPKDVDVLIIAGDLVPLIKPKALDVIRNFTANFSEIVYIFGNHCLWYASPSEVENRVLEIKDKLPNYCGNFHVLDKSTVTINGITFAGATTWFADTPESRLFQMYLNDFNYIKDFVPWVYEENERSLEFWETVEADVWVMHHAPSYLSMHPKYAGSKINCYFFEPAMETIIGWKQPKLVCHGHLHDSSDYPINQSRVICNPYGYETSDGRALNKDFRYDFVVEV